MANKRNDFGALVLAAGKGTRMYSSAPKVLQQLLGEPMLSLVYRALEPVVGSRIWTVVGFGADQVASAFPEMNDRFVLQEPQLGTGHALSSAWPVLKGEGLTWCLVINGDAPLVSAEALQGFADQVTASGAALGFMSLSLDHPGAYGRVVRAQDNRVTAVVEARDFDTALHGPDCREVNAGIYCLRLEAVEPLLAGLTSDNAQAEFYITQLVDLCVGAGQEVLAVNCGQDQALLGINSPLELVQSEERLRQKLVATWLDRGVVIRQADGVRIGPGVHLEPGASVTGPCEIYGSSRIESGAVVESHCWIRDTDVGKGSRICSFSHLLQARVGQDCVVGPYARLRPGASLMQDARVGNFVEVKKSLLENGVKVNHLSYIGDATIGAGANVGAGTITCNYDGKNKHQTHIGAGAFIGSNTALVAPVTIGDRALVGAGSTITRDVPEDALAVARTRQSNLPKKKVPGR